LITKKILKHLDDILHDSKTSYQAKLKDLLTTKRDCVSRLLHFLPLKEKDSEHVHFAGVAIGKHGNYLAEDPSLSSAFLGWLVLFIQKLSLLIGIKLPYKMSYRGSHSLVHDMSGHAYILHNRDEQIQNFQRAIYYLNCNVYYLPYDGVYHFRNLIDLIDYYQNSTSLSTQQLHPLSNKVLLFKSVTERSSNHPNDLVPSTMTTSEPEFEDFVFVTLAEDYASHFDDNEE